MIHSPFEESILWTCLENQELLKKALTILSLDCCSTDAGLEVQHSQPPANSACFRLASTILTGNSHVLSIILLLLFWIQWYLCTDRLLGLSYVWSQGEILSATKDLSVHSWMEFPPSTWLIPEFVLSNPCGGCFIPKLCPTFATPWTVVRQAPLSMGFPRQEYWSGFQFLLQGIFLTQRSNPSLLYVAGRFFTTEPPGKSISISASISINIFIGIYKIYQIYKGI